MTKIIYNLFFAFSFLLIFSCGSKKSVFVKYSNSEISYSGRIDTSLVDAAELYWSGSSIKLNLGKF